MLRRKENGRAGLGVQRTRGSVYVVSRKGQGHPLMGQGTEGLCANLPGPSLKNKVFGDDSGGIVSRRTHLQGQLLFPGGFQAGRQKTGCRRRL